MFGLGATLSNFLGQYVVEQFGHVASLTGSLVLSVIPIVIFGLFMPETLGDRDGKNVEKSSSSSVTAEDSSAGRSSNVNASGTAYVEMD
jgi:hypothetical protein